MKLLFPFILFAFSAYKQMQNTVFVSLAAPICYPSV